MKKKTFWTGATILILMVFTISGCATTNSYFSPYSAYFQGVKDRLEKGLEINSYINDNQDTLLHISVQNNAFKEVSYLLKNGANPNAKNLQNLYPIHYLLNQSALTSDKNQARIITLLSNHEANFDTKDEDGKTPLITAIEQNKPLSVKALLEAKANPNAPYQTNTPLMLAVKTGNLEIIELLLKDQQKPNIKNKKNQTALHYTALSESNGTDEELSKIAETLIDSGAKFPIEHYKNTLNIAIENNRPLVAEQLIRAIQSSNDPNRDFFSPLMNAVYDGNLNTVRELLKTPQDPNIQDKNKWAALHVAAHKESKGSDSLKAKITKELIKAGANINLRGPDGNTPLHIAISNKEYAIINLLLNEKSNLRVQNDEGETALIKAIQMSDTDTVQETISIDTINIKDNYGWSPLHFASNLKTTDQQKIIKLLLESGAEIDAQNSKGDTPLHISIENSNINASRQLLSNNSNKFIQNHSGQSPLMIATKHADIETTRNLITTPQDLNIQDNNGWTALHYISNKSTQRNDIASAKIVQILINAGADMDIQTNNKDSALHFSVKRNHLNITEILSKSGANASLKDNNGITPLILAVQNSNYAIVEKILQKTQNLDVKQSDGWTALHFTAFPKESTDDATLSKIAQAILNSGANVDIKIPTGETALSIAIGNNYPKVAKTLLDFGADINARDNNGWTPLMLAVYLGKINLIQQMMEKPGDINTKNNDGMTALHFTANSSSAGGDQLQTEIAKLLLSKGADINATAAEGSTVLHFAAANNKEALVKILLTANASTKIRNLKNWDARDEASKARHTNILQLFK